MEGADGAPFGVGARLRWLVGAGLALLVGLTGAAMLPRFGDQPAADASRQAEAPALSVPLEPAPADGPAAPSVEPTPPVALLPSAPPSPEASLPEPAPAAPSVEPTPPVALLPPAPPSPEVNLPEPKPAPPSPAEAGTPAAPSPILAEPAAAPLAGNHPDPKSSASPETSPPALAREAAPRRSIRPRVTARPFAGRRPGNEARSGAVARPPRLAERPADAGSIEPEKRRPVARRLIRPKPTAPPAARPRLARRPGGEDATASLPRPPRRAQPGRSSVESRVSENKSRPFTLPEGLRPSWP